MACRLKNTGRHTLCVDLRGGEAMHLKPGHISPPMREELLYGNTHIKGWISQGVLDYLPSKMQEVTEYETGRKADIKTERPEQKAEPSEKAKAGSGRPAGKKLELVEGIGAQTAQKLIEAGIETTDDLIALSEDDAALAGISETTGLSSKRLQDWAAMTALMTIKGIGAQNAELLVAAGIGSLDDLSAANAGELAGKVAELNAKKKLAKTAPSEKQIADWIKKAGKSGE